MTGGRVERRLAAVVAADVAGYSRLMAQDELGTLEALKSLRREVLDPAIASHNGRVVKTTGDGMLVEFASAVDAVTCAVSLQDRMSGKPASKIAFRIGINIGDIIVDGDDIFGDGVNVAARVENECEPGGVCLSGSAYEQVRGKTAFTFDDLGERNLKNIDRPVRIYAARWASAQSANVPPAGESKPLTPPDKPSIAVLPFQNMSGDLEQEYFADGVVEEITTALSRFNSFFVIARNSSFTYKGKAIDIKQVGRELGVRYVLEGSVRKSATRLRITGQLVDAASGAHIWAERFDGDLGDIFDLQDRITENVVVAIAPKIEQAEIERSKHKPTERLNAYDCYLQAMSYFHKWTNDSISEALRLFYKAIELDPNFASAHGLAAWCYVRRRLSGWMKDPAQEMAELERLAHRAEELANDDPVPLYSGGWALAQIDSRAEMGASMIDRALKINPNIPDAWLVGGWAKVYLGEPDKAIDYFRRAIRLNPLDPLMARMQTGVAAAQFLAGHYKEAALSAQSALRQHPDDQPLLRVAASSHALAGEMADAQKTLARVCQLNPALCLSNVAELAPCRRPEDVSKYVDGMRKAGLPK